MSTTVSTRSPESTNATRQQLDDLDALLKRMLDLPVNQLDAADASQGSATKGRPASAAVPRRAAAARSAETRSAAPPVSYIAIETAAPRPLPTASGFAPSPQGMSLRLVPLAPAQEIPLEDGPVPAPTIVPVPAETPPAVGSSTEAEMWVPLRSTWQPSAQTWQPLAERWQQAKSAAPPQPKPDAALPRAIALSEPVTTAPKAVESIVRITPVAAAPAEPQLNAALDPAESGLRLLLPFVWFNEGFDASLAPFGAPGRWLCGRGGRHVLGALGLMCLAAAVVVVVSARMGWTW